MRENPMLSVLTKPLSHAMPTHIIAYARHAALANSPKPTLVNTRGPATVRFFWKRESKQTETPINSSPVWSSENHFDLKISSIPPPVTTWYNRFFSTVIPAIPGGEAPDLVPVAVELLQGGTYGLDGWPSRQPLTAPVCDSQPGLTEP